MSNAKMYSDPDLTPNRGVADGIGRAKAAIDDRVSDPTEADNALDSMNKGTDEQQ